MKHNSHLVPTSTLLLVLLASSCHVVTCTPTEAVQWSQSLAEAWESAISVAGAKSVIESAFESSTVQTPVPIEVLSQDTADDISQQFQVQELFLESLVEAAIDEYIPPSADDFGPFGDDCCGLSPFGLSSSDADLAFYGVPVDKDNTCYRISPWESKKNDPVKADLSWTEALLPVMKEQRALSSHIGTPSGVWRVHPASSAPEKCGWSDCYQSCSTGCAEYHPECSGRCAEYDPRLRPWYLQAAAPDIDLLILMENGDFAENSAAAIEILLGTLSRQSRFQIIVHNGSGSKTRVLPTNSEGCDVDSYIAANQENVDSAIRALKDAVSSADPGSDWNDIWDDVRSLYETSDSFTNSNPTAIAWFTHGEPTTGEDEPFALRAYIKDTLDEVKSALGSVDLGLFIFSIGPARSDLPANIARDWETSNSGPAIFLEGGDLEDVQGRLASLYQSFSSSTSGIAWTPPYCDANGNGVLITGTYPIYKGDDFIGVAGVDVILSNAFGAATSLWIDEQYSFVVDRDGVVLLHPLMGAPEAATSPPRFVDIVELETHPSFAPVRQALISAANTTLAYNVTLNATTPLVSARGDVATEGSRSTPIEYTFSIQSIVGSPFALAVARPVSYVGLNRLGSDAGRPDPESLDQDSDRLWYHRLDKDRPRDASKPILGGPSWLTSDEGLLDWETDSSATVKFAPRAFASPANYLGSAEDKDFVEALNDWLNSETLPSAGSNADSFPTEAAAVDARAIASAISAWQEVVGTEELRKLYRWVYFGSSTGAFVSVPGFVSPRWYDNTARSWYARAWGLESGGIAVSPPYQTTGGDSTVLTLSQRIADHGVVGIDMTYPQFHMMMVDAGCPLPTTSQLAAWNDPTSPLFTTKWCSLVDQSLFIVATDTYTVLANNGEITREKEQAGLGVEGEEDFDPDLELDPKEYSVPSTAVWLGNVSQALAAALITDGAFAFENCSDYQSLLDRPYYVPTALADTVRSGELSRCDETGTWSLSRVGNSSAWLIVVDDYYRRNSLSCDVCETVCPLSSAEYRQCVVPEPCNMTIECVGRDVVRDYESSDGISGLGLSCPAPFNPWSPEPLVVPWWVWTLGAIALALILVCCVGSTFWCVKRTKACCAARKAKGQSKMDSTSNVSDATTEASDAANPEESTEKPDLEGATIPPGETF